MICVTPNAAIDRTLVVQGFAQGGVFRPTEQLINAGGKGVNVARAARVLGGSAVCSGFLGGFSGQYAADLLRSEGLDAAWTWLPGRESRTCVILIDPETLLSSVINEQGPTVSTEDWARLHADLLRLAQQHVTVCFCGSLPPGSPQEAFTDLLHALVTAGKQVWVDTSGAALQNAAKVHGAALKINGDEAAALVGMPLHTPAEAAAAARTLHQRTGAKCAITLGARGAVLADEHGAWYAQPPAVQSKSALGSGDTFLAGMLTALEQGEQPPEALRRAAAAGTANTLSLGGGRFERAQFEQILAKTYLEHLPVEG